MKLKRGNIKMKIQEQVLSIEQMKHLQELGVDTSNASMCWAGNDVVPNNGAAFDLGYDGIPTYTIGDLIEKLPKNIDLGFGEHDPEILIKGEYVGVQYTNGGDYTPFSCSPSSLIEALYSILCMLAENHKKLL